MRNTVHKFPLELVDHQTVTMSIDAKILTVGLQNNIICLWAEVDTRSNKRSYAIQIVGTGNPMPKRVRQYIGTVHKTPFVWHVYYLPEGGMDMEIGK